MDDTFKGLRGKTYAKRVASNHFWGQRGSATSIGKHLWWQVDFDRSATRCTRMGKECPRRSRARSSKVTDRSNQVPPQGASSAHARTGEISGARRESAIARPAWVQHSGLIPERFGTHRETRNGPRVHRAPITTRNTCRPLAYLASTHLTSWQVDFTSEWLAFAGLQVSRGALPYGQ